MDESTVMLEHKSVGKCWNNGYNTVQNVVHRSGVLVAVLKPVSGFGGADLLHL